MLLGFAATFFYLNSQPFPVGPDAYAYLKQLSVFFETGHLHYKDLTLFYPLLILINFFVRQPELSLKILQSLMIAGWVYIVGRLSVQNKNTKAQTILLMGLALASPNAHFVCYQFPKQFLAVLFLILFLYFWINQKKRLAFFWAVAAFFTHRLMAGIIFLMFAYELFVLIKNNKLNKKWLLGLGSLIIVSQILPGGFHFSDLERFKSVFSAVPSLIFVQMPLKIYSHSFSFALEQFILGMIFCYFLLKKSKTFPAFIILLAILVFPFFNFGVLQPGYRFYLTFLLLVPALLLTAHQFKRQSLILLGALSVFFLLTYPSHYSFKVWDPPYARYESLTNQIKLNVSPLPGQLIIVHKPFNEVISYRNKIYAMAWLPEYPVKNLLRISFGVTHDEFKYYLKQKSSQITMLDQTYALLPEPLWQEFVQKVIKENDQSLMRWIFSDQNPNKVRPEFLLRLKIKPRS